MGIIGLIKSFFFSLKKPSQKTPGIVRPWAGPRCHTAASPGDGWLVLVQGTEPGFSPKQGQATLLLPQCLKRSWSPHGDPFHTQSEAETPGKPGKWRARPLLCGCHSWAQFSGPRGTGLFPWPLDRACHIPGASFVPGCERSCLPRTLGLQH